MTDYPTPQEALEMLTAARDSTGALAGLFGPTQDFHVSECEGGGWLVWRGVKPYAACSESWEVPEIMGRVMAEKFGKSFVRPERADDITPRDGQTDHQNERLPRFVQPPDRPHQSDDNVVEPRFGPRVRETVQLVLIAVIVGVHAIVGA